MSLVGFVQRRLRGEFEVDEFGLDQELLRGIRPLTRLRWTIDSYGTANLPADGPGLVCFSQCFGLSEPWVVASAIARETPRHLRVLGVSDVAVIGPTLRKLGASAASPEELAALLRAGHLVGSGLAIQPFRQRRAGGIDPDHLAVALDLDVPVYPAAVVGRELGRAWRVDIGPGVERPVGRGPLAEAVLAERVQAGAQRLLDAVTAVP